MRGYFQDVGVTMIGNIFRYSIRNSDHQRLPGSRCVKIMTHMTICSWLLLSILLSGCAINNSDYYSGSQVHHASYYVSAANGDAYRPSVSSNTVYPSLTADSETLDFNHAKTSGDSIDYGARVRACVVSGVLFAAPARRTDENPTVQYRVRLLTDGSIDALQLKKTSGNPAFDRAVGIGIWRCQPFPAVGARSYPAYIDINYQMYDASFKSARPIIFNDKTDLGLACAIIYEEGTRQTLYFYLLDGYAEIFTFEYDFMSSSNYRVWLKLRKIRESMDSYSYEVTSTQPKSELVRFSFILNRETLQITQDQSALSSTRAVARLTPRHVATCTEVQHPRNSYQINKNAFHIDLQRVTPNNK
jgi:TonB family protein